MAQIMTRLLEDTSERGEEFEGIIELDNIEPTEDEVQKAKEQIQNQEK